MISVNQVKIVLQGIILILLIYLPGSMCNLLYAQSSHMIPTDHRGQIRKDSLQKVVPSTIADTMLHFSFPPVEIRGAYNFKNKHQEKKYRQLFEDIKRTYPLSQIVLHEVRSVDGAIDSTYWTKAQVKAYLKWYEKQIFNTYIDTLKSLNIRQIQLFIKLIDRETGNSPYKLIKKYRGGLDAFLWQLAANAMMLNLKREYDPAEEAIIEDIVTKFY